MTAVNVSITQIPRLCLPVRKNQNPAVATPNRQHDRKLASGSSGDSLPPSPPAEKATARQDQAGQSCTGDGARDGVVRNKRGKKAVVMITAVAIRPDDLSKVIDTVNLRELVSGHVNLGEDAIAVYKPVLECSPNGRARPKPPALGGHPSPAPRSPP